MASGFELRFTQFFERQWLGYDGRTREFIRGKLLLLKENPYRYPTQKGYARVRKLKLSVEGKYQRLMYAVHYPDSDTILVLGIFARDKDYQDFERKYKQLKK